MLFLLRFGLPFIREVVGNRFLCLDGDVARDRHFN